MFGTEDSIGFSTVGREFHPGLSVPLWHNPAEAFSAEPGSENRFRLILVEQGTGILQLNGGRQTFIAPTLFCLNENDIASLEQSREPKAQALYFHPAIINNNFNFENIRERHEQLVGTANQDSEWLLAFVHRDDSYSRQLHVGAPTARRIASLFRAASDELAQQRNHFWPCRSRSFLLEVLFIVYRIFSALPEDNPQLTEDRLLESCGEVDPIILHLHTHYHEKLTVEMLARTFHTNRTTLEERFRQATGAPIMTYLIRLRLRLAAAMLHDTALPISEVADRVGFKDTTHFGRAFRKYIGCSPLEYRQRYCWMLQ
jgi:AraC-like DNA-binding protein